MTAEIHNLWKTYLYKLQIQAPKPKAVKCLNKVDFSPSYYGTEFHGSISRNEADKLLQEAGEGSYLVRESQRLPGTFTLCLRYGGNIKNYKLFYDGKRHYVGEKKLTSLDSLVADGLITMHVETRARQYLETMAEQAIYENSPYITLRGKQQRNIDGPHFPKAPIKSGEGQVPLLPKDLDQIVLPFYSNHHHLVNPLVPRVDDVSPKSTIDLEPSRKGVRLGLKLCGKVTRPTNSSRRFSVPTILEEIPKGVNVGKVRISKGPTKVQQHTFMSDDKGSSHAESQISLTTPSSSITALEHPRSCVMTRKSYHINNEPQFEPIPSSGIGPFRLDCQPMQHHYSTLSLQKIIPNRNPFQRPLFNEMRKFSYTRPKTKEVPIPEDIQANYHENGSRGVVMRRKKGSITDPTLFYDGLLNHINYPAGHMMNNYQAPTKPTIRYTSSPLNTGTERNIEEARRSRICSFMTTTPSATNLTNDCDTKNFYSNGFGSLRLSTVHPNRSTIAGSAGGAIPTNQLPSFVTRPSQNPPLPPPLRLARVNASKDSKAYTTCLGVGHNTTGHCRQKVNHGVKADRDISLPSYSLFPLPVPSLRATSPLFSNNISPSINSTVVTSTKEPNLGYISSKPSDHQSSAYALTEGSRAHVIPTNDTRFMQNKSQAMEMVPLDNGDVFPPAPDNTCDKYTGSTPNYTHVIKISECDTVREKSKREGYRDMNEETKSSPPTNKNNHSNGSEGSTSSNQSQSSITDSPTLQLLNNTCDSGYHPGMVNYEKAHIFKVHTFKGMHWCDFCGNFMWGLVAQGVRCKDCGLGVHKRCSHRIPDDCAPDAHKWLKCRIFGVDLTCHLKSLNIQEPIVLTICTRLIETTGIESEGIYRVPGYAEDIETLRQYFDSGIIIDGTECVQLKDINVVAGVLKLYFRLLPIPLITFDAYQYFLDALKMATLEEQISSLINATTMLPPLHHNTLKKLMEHLKRVSDHQKTNLMSASNLAMVFAPNIIRNLDSYNDQGGKQLHDSFVTIKYEGAVIEMLIKHQNLIFP